MDRTIRSTDVHGKHGSSGAPRSRRVAQGIPAASLQSPSCRADKAGMAQPTRFDLSRLEGCTGTLSDRTVAVPHALRPAGAPATQPARPVGPAPAPPSRVPAPEAPNPVRVAPAPGPEPRRESDRSATPPRSPAPPRRAPVREDPAPASAAQPSVNTAVALPDAESKDRVSFCVVLALTLLAWIPVLVLWWARIA